MTIETNPKLLRVEVYGHLLDGLNILYYLLFRTQVELKGIRKKM